MRPRIGGSLTAALLVFALLPVAPASAGGPPTGATQPPYLAAVDVTFQASLSSDDGQVSYHFDYGTTTDYGTQTPGATVSTGSSGTSVQETVHGLARGTTYHVHVEASNSSGPFVGDDVTFTTRTAPPGGGTSHSITTTSNSADLSGFLSSDDGAVTYHFEYGTTSALGTSTPGGTLEPSSDGMTVSPTSVTEHVGGLAANTTYQMRVVASNHVGTLTGDIVSFTTSAPPPADADGDGVPDNQDGCPTQAGPSNNGGCPVSDSDHDGIPDNQDGCPTAAGTRATNGCPDTDGDGIMDSQDACPTLAGPFDTRGCPDADHDGVNDPQDLCPTVAGFDRSDGCLDSDSDGIIDPKDACPLIGPDPRYPHRTIQADGCPLTYVEFRVVPLNLNRLQDGPPQILTRCFFTQGAPCTVHATVTISKAEQKAAKLSSRTLYDATIPLTTLAQQIAADPVDVLRPGHEDELPPAPKYYIKFSAATKKKLGTIKALTLSVEASYTLGSGHRIGIPSKSFTLVNHHQSTIVVSNHPHETDQVRTDGDRLAV